MIQDRVKLGPIDANLPGAMVISMGMYGDIIQEVDIEFGFTKRLIEEGMIGKNVREAQPKFSRIDPESSFLQDRLYCEAVEKITHTSISERTLWIREITTLLGELNGFLRYLSKMSSRLGIEILTHIILKHRESLLDQIELLTGSRYGYYYVIPGGVRYDLTEGFQERLERWVESFTQDFDRIEALFCWTHLFQNRLQSIGRVADNGRYGFVSESSVETARFGLVSHVESRLLYVLNQCKSLCEEIQAMFPERHTGETLSKLGTQRIAEPVRVKLDTARGGLSIMLWLDKNLIIKTIKTEMPSDQTRAAIIPALEGECYEDIPVILESLNFSIPEIDR